MTVFTELFHDRDPYHRIQSIDLLCKLMNWFLLDTDLRHERVNWERKFLSNGNSCELEILRDCKGPEPTIT